MWKGVQLIFSNTTSEILVRIVLMITVYIMHVCIEPHIQDITEFELVYYKRPQRESLIPPCVMVLLIVCVPLVILSLPSLKTGVYTDMTQSLLAWTLACVINAFITESAKLIVGRPRPDFFYRCYPNGKITKDLRCTGINKDVMDGRKSFPSGHSSFSFCSLGFISIWLCGKLRVLSRNRGDGLRVVACLVPLVVAGVVSMSRCCDNHHHWEDVFTGSIIGFTSSYFCYRQYYFALDSEQSGSPYLRMGSELRNGASREGCCTKGLALSSSICSKCSESNKYNWIYITFLLLRSAFMANELWSSTQNMLNVICAFLVLGHASFIEKFPFTVKHFFSGFPRLFQSFLLPSCLPHKRKAGRSVEWWVRSGYMYRG